MRSSVVSLSAPAVLLVGVLVHSIATPAGAAIIAHFDTTEGTVDVRLFDEDAPETVNNFLNYVLRGDYDGALFHRSASFIDGTPFVLQGGGFKPGSPDPIADFVTIPTDAAVVNEPGISNTRGTIAMAKQGGNPDSATNQFFVNLGDNGDNAAALDTQNGGFTVFGEVDPDDMSKIDAIAALPTVDADPFPNDLFDSLPILDAGGGTASASNLAIISSVTALLVGDANGDGMVTADDLIAIQHAIDVDFDGEGAMPGDANFDDVVNADDFSVVGDAENFGDLLPAVAGSNAAAGLLLATEAIIAGSSSSGGASAFDLPEPGTGALVAASLVLIARRRPGGRVGL